MHWIDPDSEFLKYLGDLLSASKVAISIADYGQDDCPLVAVNDGFCELTGYDPGEILGRNCRFLQPAGGAGPVRERIREFIDGNGAREGKFLIPNKRKDGSDFLNLLYLGKLNYEGRTRLVIGSQFDITRFPYAEADLYERALQEDLREMSKVAHREGWTMLGTYDVLAKSQSLIAQARLDALKE